MRAGASLRAERGSGAYQEAFSSNRGCKALAQEGGLD